MIILLSLFLLTITLSLIKKHKGTYLCVGTIYAFAWYIALAVSSVGLYGLYIPSNQTYYLCFLSSVIFTIVTLKYGRVNPRIDSDSPIFTQYTVRKKVLIAIHSLIYVFIASELILAIYRMQEYGFGGVRGLDKGQSTAYLLIMQWIVVPIFSVTTIIGSIDYQRTKKIGLTMLLAISDTAIYSIMYGGRYSVFRLLFFLLFSSILFSNSSALEYVKKNRLTMLSVIGLIVLLSNLTSERSLSGFDFTGNIIGYYTGSIVFMSELLNSPSPDLTYGGLTFGFIWNTFCAIVKVLFGSYWGTNAIYESQTADYLQIGFDTRYNALCTYIYPFVLDFGIYFFWVGSIIYASLINYFERKYSERKSYPLLIIYMFVAYSTFNSLLVSDYIYPNFFFVMLFSYVLLKKVSYK